MWNSLSLKYYYAKKKKIIVISDQRKRDFLPFHPAFFSYFTDKFGVYVMVLKKTISLLPWVGGCSLRCTQNSITLIQHKYHIWAHQIELAATNRWSRLFSSVINLFTIDWTHPLTRNKICFIGLNHPHHMETDVHDTSYYWRVMTCRNY